MTPFADDAAREAFTILDGTDRARLERLISVECYYSSPVVGNAAGNWSSGLPGVRTLIARRSFRDKENARLAMMAAVDHMLLEGRLRLQYPPEGRVADAGSGYVRLGLEQPRRTGTAAENAEAYRRNLVGRIASGLTSVQQSALADLFGRIRTAEMVVDTRRGTLAMPGRSQRYALAIPTLVQAGGQGAVVRSATVLSVAPWGALQAFALTRAHLGTQATAEGGVLVAELHDLRGLPKIGETVPRLLPRVEIGYVSLSYEFDWLAIEDGLGFALPVRVRRAFLHALVRRRRDRGAVAGALLRPELDAPCMSALARSTSNGPVDLYNWLATRSRIRASRRQQAASAYPLLTPIIFEVLSGLVDKGDALAPALAKTSGMAPHVLRRVGSLYWQRLGAAAAKTYNEPGGGPGYAGFLNACPPERLPVSKADWKAFHSFAASLQMVLWPLQRHCAVSDGSFVQDVMGCMSRNWQGVIADGRGIADMLRDVADRTASALCGLRCLAYADNPYLLASAAAHVLVAGEKPSWKHLCERTDAWHMRARHLAGGLEQASSRGGQPAVRQAPVDWLALDQDFAGPQGGRIEWLTDRGLLAMEGSALGHCVWSYANSCLYHGSHIGALRAADGSRSTVEVVCRRGAEDKWSLEVRQHRGPANHNPSSACAGLLRAFMELRTGHVAFAAIEAARQERNACRPAGGDTYDWTDQEFCAAVLELYRPFLSRSWRKSAPAEMGHAVAAELARMMADPHRQAVWLAGDGDGDGDDDLVL